MHQYIVVTLTFPSLTLHSQSPSFKALISLSLYLCFIFLFALGLTGFNQVTSVGMCVTLFIEARVTYHWQHHYQCLLSARRGPMSHLHLWLMTRNNHEIELEKYNSCKFPTRQIFNVNPDNLCADSKHSTISMKSVLISDINTIA